MRWALFNLYLGHKREHWELCLETQKRYCEKHNIDHYISKEYKLTDNYFPDSLKNYFEKLQFLDLFDEGYDQVLLADCDIIITPHADNIFQRYSDVKKIYAFDENYESKLNIINPFGKVSDIMDRDLYIDIVLNNCEEELNWKRNKHNKYQYFNTGVMVFGRESVKQFSKLKGNDSLSKVKEIFSFFSEQTYYNAFIQKYNIPVDTIDFSFNRMSILDRDLDKYRYKANFIHYSGPCIYSLEEKETWSYENNKKIISTDYKNLYG